MFQLGISLEDHRKGYGDRYLGIAEVIGDCDNCFLLVEPTDQTHEHFRDG